MGDLAIPVCWCGLLMRRVYVMPNISADLASTSRPEAHEANLREKRWSKDREAYRRMRRDGVQPRSVNGAAHIERYAETRHEVEMGQIMPKRWVREGVKLAEEVVKKDLEV